MTPERPLINSPQWFLASLNRRDDPQTPPRVGASGGADAIVKTNNLIHHSLLLFVLSRANRWKMAALRSAESAVPVSGTGLDIGAQDRLPGTPGALLNPGPSKTPTTEHAVEVVRQPCCLCQHLGVAHGDIRGRALRLTVSGVGGTGF